MHVCFWSPGSASSQQWVGLARKLEGRSVVISNLLHCYHDSDLCLPSSDCRNYLWSASVLPTF